MKTLPDYSFGGANDPSIFPNERAAEMFVFCNDIIQKNNWKQSFC